MTVTLHLGDEDLLEVRFAISPIWEVVNAVRTLVDERSRRHHAPWASAARAAAPRLDLGVLMALHPRRGYVPDFASPPPERGAPSLASSSRSCARRPRRAWRTSCGAATPRTVTPARGRCWSA